MIYNIYVLYALLMMKLRIYGDPLQNHLQIKSKFNIKNYY